MPLINTSVPNLIQGVSQQPDATRFAGQCAEQENALCSIADGLKKRPNTRHVARLLETAIASNSFVHFINRDATEKYVVIHTGVKVYAYNILTGVEATINGSTGGYEPTVGSYLDVQDPLGALKALTVADRTYILNSTKTVAATTNTSPSLNKQSLLFIKQGDYEKLYGVKVTLHPSATDTSSATEGQEIEARIRSSEKEQAFSAGSARIAEQLAMGSPNTYSASVSANMTTRLGTYFTIELYGNLIVMTKKDDVWDGDFTITTFDDLGGGGLGSVYKEIDAISSLPLYAKNGFKTRVSGNLDLDQDDYYVEFQTANGADIGEGGWQECLGPDVPLGIDNTTMPHNIINDDVDSFLISSLSFSDRVSGDLNSNPTPSFVENTISNMFFFKNRLGFLSRDTVSLSESGLATLNDQGVLEYNFLRNTVSSLLDSDPISVAVASTRVTNLRAAIGFQENLILFSDGGQFSLRGGELLTPKSVSVTPITSFSFDSNTEPLSLGPYIYFPFTRGSFTGVREFSVNASTDVYDSVETTEHVPAYIPKNIVDMTGTSAEDMIALTSEEEPNAIYVYNYFWNNNQKVISAWSKFTFTGDIRAIEFINSKLYAVITNNEETNLVEMPLEAGLTDAAGYVTHLDMRVTNEVLQGSSTITLPYTPEDNSVQVYTHDGLALTCTNSGSTVTLNNPVSADTDVWVGLPYTMTYTFSEQLFKAKSGKGASPSNAARMQLRNGSLYFSKTAYFKVKVTPKFRDTYENVFTPDVIGSTTLGSLSLDSGFYRFPIFTKPEDTTITIENDSALPSTFQSAEFESFVHSRSNRYG
tara:strand:- start:281 stop:2728 length:2448 start_codon:yes stop_codon:yes gene_type:complete